jgi:hypothetical protein
MRGRIVILNRAILEDMAGDAYGVPEQEYKRLMHAGSRRDAAKKVLKKSPPRDRVGNKFVAERIIGKSSALTVLCNPSDRCSCPRSRLGNDRWFNGFLWPVVWAPSLKSGGAFFTIAKAPSIPTSPSANAMVLEEFWEDASSRTIDFRVARMRVATGFPTYLASFGSPCRRKFIPVGESICVRVRQSQNHRTVHRTGE